jgi:hypothetical protein
MPIFIILLSCMVNAYGKENSSHINSLQYDQNIKSLPSVSFILQAQPDLMDPKVNCIYITSVQSDGRIQRYILNPHNGLNDKQLTLTLKAFPVHFTRVLKSSVYNPYMLFVPYYTAGTYLRPDVFNEDPHTAYAMDLALFPYLGEYLIRNKRFDGIKSEKVFPIQRIQMIKFIESISKTSGKKENCVL